MPPVWTVHLNGRSTGTSPCPLLRPVLVVITLLTTIWTYNNFVYVWLTTQGGPGNYHPGAGDPDVHRGIYQLPLGYGAAVGVLMSVTMLLFSIVYFVTVFRRSTGQT